jgi:hypothetical protein
MSSNKFNGIISKHVDIVLSHVKNRKCQWDIIRDVIKLYQNELKLSSIDIKSVVEFTSNYLTSKGAGYLKDIKSKSKSKSKR